MLLHLGEEEWDERRDAEEGEAQAHFEPESLKKNSRGFSRRRAHFARKGEWRPPERQQAAAKIAP